MQTTERTSSEIVDRIPKLQRRNRTLVWLSGMLAAFVLAAGAWIIFDGFSASDLTPVQEEMLDTIDAYLEAWNSGDGTAATELMSVSGYHDNGDSRYYAAEGRLAAFIDLVHDLNFTVSRTGAAFVGDYVMTTEHIPASSEVDRPSIYRMSNDGTLILWHLAP